MKPEQHKEISLKVAVILFSLVLIWIISGILLYKIPIVTLLFISTVAIALFSSAYLKHSLEKILNDMGESVSRAMQGIFFFFLIGMAIAVWMRCGALPAIIYYGVGWLNPKFFLPTVFILASLVGISTGSAWTTAATAGVISIGIGEALGIPLPMVAGAVVSGAYFGDKMSPVSDSTNMAPLSSGTTVYKHIRAMWPVTAIAYVIAFAIYSFVSIKYHSGGVSMTDALALRDAIAGVFNINVLVMLPLILVMVLSILQFPAIPIMVLGIALSIPIAQIFQGAAISEILTNMTSGVHMTIENPMVARIVNRGGVVSMMSTTAIIIMSLSFGGLMSGSGIFPVMISKLTETVKNSRIYPMITICMGTLLVLGCADNYAPLTLIGPMMGPAYDRLGLDRSMLSRNVEEGSTIIAVMVPWASSAVFFSGALGVATLDYMPYAFLNYITVILGALLPLFGFTIFTKEKVDRHYADKKNAQNSVAVEK